MFRPGRASGPPPDESVYDGPIDRAFDRVREWKESLDRERREAGLKIAGLLSGARRVGGSSSAEKPGFWTWGLCEVLLERSWSLRHEDPKQMLVLAGLAREAADRIDPKLYGEVETTDLRVRAWGEYANALRVTDDLFRASWALSRALELRHQGSGSQLIRARLAELSAGLLCHQRHFPAAFKALDLAYSLYQREGHPQDAVRVLVKRGIYTGRSGDPELGIQLLAKALLLIDRQRDPKLCFLILHNLLLFRVELGEFRVANLQLFEMRPLYVEHAGAVDKVKLRWIEGRIAAGLGEFERAERAFLQVREEFERRGQIYHAAVVILDLTGIWLRRGRTDDVKRLVGEILSTFRARYVARETIAALLMLREALDQDRASLDLVTIVASVIERNQDESSEAGYHSAL
jgi:tetratricopeptide (TPR) repeat protein